MTGQAGDDRIRGMTLRWIFTDGPQAGKKYEHTFHDDGTVSYRAIADEPDDPTPDRQEGGTPPEGERPLYAAYSVSETVHLVSYRAASGFTLTVALNYATHEMVGIASNSEQWFPAKGTFAEVGTTRP